MGPSSRSEIFRDGLLEGRVVVVSGAGTGLGRAASLEMIRLGAYRRGSDPLVDEAIHFNPAIEAFLKQSKRERSELIDGYRQLAEILGMEDPTTAGGDAEEPALVR